VESLSAIDDNIEEDHANEECNLHAANDVLNPTILADW
jgi:hypothetical protein